MCVCVRVSICVYVCACACVCVCPLFCLFTGASKFIIILSIYLSSHNKSCNYATSYVFSTMHRCTPCSYIYHISRNIDSDFNLTIWRSHKDHQINLRNYQSIYTTSIGFSTYSTQNCQFKILPTAFF